MNEKIKIVVCIKAVPSKIVNEDEKNMPAYIINPYDLYSLKQVVNLKKQTDCSITCICMGRSDLDDVVYKCKAMGVDEVILLSDESFAGADTYATAYTLAETIKKIPFDIVVCGAEAIDGETGQVPIALARRLGVLCINGVETIIENNGEIIFECIEKNKKTTIRAKKPLLIAMNSCITKSMPINLLALKKAKKSPIVIWDREKIGLSKEKVGQAGSKTVVCGSIGSNFTKKDTKEIKFGNDDFTRWFENVIRI